MLERLLALWPVAMLGLAIVILLQILRGIRDRARVREQLFARTRTRTELPEELAGEAPDRYWGSWLERWLFVSGFRGTGALSRFLVAQGIAVAIGMALALLASWRRDGTSFCNGQTDGHQLKFYGLVPPPYVRGGSRIYLSRDRIFYLFFFFRVPFFRKRLSLASCLHMRKHDWRRVRVEPALRSALRKVDPGLRPR